MHEKRILIVEDEEMIADLEKEILEEIVTTASLDYSLSRKVLESAFNLR